MTVTEASTLLSPYVGAGNVFLTRLNLVRARLIQIGNWPDCIRLITIAVTTDSSTGFNVIVLPSGYSTILACCPIHSSVTVADGLVPLGVRDVFSWFSSNSLGYGSKVMSVQELAPNPLAPTSKRYQVPTSTTDGYSYICLAKIAYVALTAGTDTVTPDNVGALKAGLQALLAEDSDNRGLSRELWQEAMALLAEQSENLTGAAASGRIEVADELELEQIGCTI